MDERGFSHRWRVFDQPGGDALDFRQVMSLRAVVTIDPAADLAFQVALRFAEIAQADRLVVQTMQPDQIINKRFAQSPRHVWRKGQARRRIFAEDDSSDWFREVKGRAQYGVVIAEKEDARSFRVSGMQLREHAILAAHIVSRLDLASERRAPQDHFPITETH